MRRVLLSLGEGQDDEHLYRREDLSVESTCTSKHNQGLLRECRAVRLCNAM